MKELLELNGKYTDPSINIALHTIEKGKQSLFFVNTKPSAEKLAEELSKKISNINLEELSSQIENALSRPTGQCKRLAACVKKGVAFHHAGLISKQRELIEDNFRTGKIRVICATPTLAIGVDLPAFRSVVRDLKRYGGRWGMQNIPVLEYQQMAGRAGRPSFDAWGEAITIAKSEDERDEIFVNYINAESENIFSKLAVEPVLRTYVLSLISSGIVSQKKSIMVFFEKTFWAYQYKDMHKLELIIERMLDLLQEWGFIHSSAGEFVAASEVDDIKYRPTLIGKRVAELYLDPYTAHSLITALNETKNKKVVFFSLMHMIANTLEMRPLLKVRTKEYDIITSALGKYEENLLFVEPSAYDLEYDEFLSSIKTALFLQDWCNEYDEEYLLEQYNIRPGEINSKRDIGDWLLYSCIEMAKLLRLEIAKELLKARVRLDHGIKEELLPLVKLKGIGRIRARKLFANGIKTISEIKKADMAMLTRIVGASTAKSIKDQLGDASSDGVSSS